MSGKNDAPAHWIATLGYEDGRPVAYAATTGTGDRMGQADTDTEPGPWAAEPVGVVTLLNWMEWGGIEQLWIHPSWSARAGLDLDDRYWQFLGDVGPWQVAAWPLNDPRRPPTWLRAFHRGVYGQREIVFPGRDAGTAWGQASSARVLLAGLRRYAELLGIPYTRSPGATGTNLIRMVHGGVRATKLQPCEQLPPMALDPAFEPLMWVWARAVTSRELAAADYLHSYDKNGQYLGACSSVVLGVGDPVAIEHWPTDGDWLYRAGYWHVLMEPPKSPDLPDPARPLPLAAPTESHYVWVTTPILRLGLELRLITDLAGAWVWPDSHRMLEPWYRRLRDARAALDAEAIGNDSEAARMALSVIKATYTRGIGWLDGDWLRVQTKRSDLYRPDWRHAIMAQARANFYRNLMAMEATGYAPIGLHTDTVYLLSSEADPVAAHPPGIRIGRGLGEFKVKDSVPLALVRDELEGLRVEEVGPRMAAFGALRRRLKELRQMGGDDEEPEGAGDAEGADDGGRVP